MSYAVHYLATLHPTEYRSTLTELPKVMVEPLCNFLEMPLLSYVNLQQKGDGLGVFNFVTKHH
jgi:hypothetical protein